MKKVFTILALLVIVGMAAAQDIVLEPQSDGTYQFEMPARNLMMNIRYYNANDTENGYTIGGVPEDWQVKVFDDIAAITDGVTTPITAGAPVTIVPPDSVRRLIKRITLRDVVTAPEGTIASKFTVSAAGDQVYFSKGNLKYDGSTWSFFDNQYDYLGTHDGTNWDMFGWSTSAPTYGMKTSTSDGDYSGDFVDWGATMGTGWRTLTNDEWTYLFNTRTASTVGGTENARYAKAKVNNVYGVILFPDTYTHPSDVTAPQGINATDASGWNGNTYDATAWAKMESAGCVFLPAAGLRDGTSMNAVGSRVYYWSSTANGVDAAYAVYFRSLELIPASSNYRYFGYSVRLVYQAQ